MQDENTDGKQSLLNNVRMHDQRHTLAQKFALQIYVQYAYYVTCERISLYSI